MDVSTPLDGVLVGGHVYHLHGGNRAGGSESGRTQSGVGYRRNKEAGNGVQKMLMEQLTKRLEFDKAMRMITALEICQCGATTPRDCDTKCPYVAESVEGTACHEKLMQDAAEFIKFHTIGNQEEQPTTRKTILEAAEKCVCHDRQDTHGKPEDSFGAIADLWTAYLDIGHEITPVDVAQMMILLKIGRAKENPKHTDNWVDMAGYAACAGEIAADVYGNDS